MSYPIKPNTASILFPLEGLNPADYFVDIDHLQSLGATATASSKYVGRLNAASNSGTIVVSTATVAGHPGVALSTPGSGDGNRIQQEVANFLPAANNPILMEAYVSFVTGGVYAIGWGEAIANQSPIAGASGLESNVHGVAAIIQTDDKLDVAASDGTTAATTLTDQVTLTAGTWYRIGVKTWPTVSEVYVDGRKVSTIRHATLAAKPMTPFAGADAGGALSVDYIGTATSIG